VARGGDADARFPGQGALPVADDLLSIIIPVKDEAATLADLIASVEEAEVPGMEKEIVIVDDGSRDETPVLLRSYEGRRGFVLLRHAENQGKGTAIRTAIPHTSGSIVAIQDADQEYDPGDLADLVEPVREGRARVVFGSRFQGSIAGMAFANRMGNRVLSWAGSVIGPNRITDEATCYKVFDREVLTALPLRCRRFEFCPEVTGLLQATGEPIVEVPIRYRGRSKARGKKVRPKDGFIAVWWLLWSRYGRRADKRGAPVALWRASQPQTTRT
jgi:dolichol-phosphate mannosyltransferase